MTHAPPGTPFLAAAALAGDLEDWGPLDEATGAPMQTSGITLWSGDGQEVGVWACTPGPSHWTLETNEAIYILAGRMTVTPDGGAPQEVGTGDCAVFPRGWRGTWQIHETIRKLYVIY
jgi:uncharacterized cupin superfamily protein